MASSYNLFKVRGIPIKLHISFVLFFPLIVLSLASQILYEQPQTSVFAFLYSFLLYFSLFGSVLFHELVHSLVARRYGMKVRQIILTPIGGIAGIGLIRDARKEFAISISGPLSNYALAAFLLIIYLFFGPLTKLFDLNSILFSVTAGGLIGSALLINLMLGTFNLFLPIFPMDGGRILRSMLAMLTEYTDYMRATRLAVRIGQIYLFILIGISIIHLNIWLIFIGAMLFVMGQAELRITETSFLFDDIGLESIVHKNLIVLDKDAKVSDFAALAAPWQTLYPVVDDKKVIGFIDSDKLKGASFDKSVGSIAEKKFNVIDVNAKPEEVMQALATGFAFVTKNKKFIGVLTMQDLEKAIEMKKQAKAS